MICIPAISPFVNYMAPATIAFIITLSMAREGIEEYVISYRENPQMILKSIVGKQMF